ncbi:uncharacterized protein LOC130503846 [Raphanus sativus]|uniref:Uncharacterized protein LOC130503846 n=1 Tax=Raphanus sativus TaxID=3726 RepID=A0A9W3CSK6_RAPSA|nr:uncharacterized protein LOC130503846 [Raphanus sativus]
MAGDQKGQLTTDEKLLLKAMNAQLQQNMKPSLDKFRQEFRQALQQATGPNLESRSSERRQRRGYEGRSNHRDNFADQKLKIPPFYGDADPAIYVEWEEKLELIFSSQNYAERKKVQLATDEFYGYASSWWNKLRKSRRLDGKEPVETWLKLSSLMRREYVPRQYYKEVLQRQKRTRKEETKMADYEKEISSLVKEILKTIKPLDKLKKLPKNQEPVTTVSELNDAESDSAAPFQEAQTETSLVKGKFEKGQEFSLFLSQSEFNFNNSFDELTCLEPVQPSRIVSVSQVAKEDSAEKEPELRF